MRATLLYSSVVPSFGAKEPAIAVRIAQVWLVLGGLAMLCLPAARGSSEWLGWLPLWLVIVPAVQLAILRWRTLFAVSGKALGHLRRHRARSAPRRARRLRKPAPSRRISEPQGALLAAFLFR